MNWVAGQRVCREEALEQLGTVTAASSAEGSVKWDDGAISFHQVGSAKDK